MFAEADRKVSPTSSCRNYFMIEKYFFFLFDFIMIRGLDKSWTTSSTSNFQSCLWDHQTRFKRCAFHDSIIFSLVIYFSESNIFLRGVCFGTIWPLTVKKAILYQNEVLFSELIIDTFFRFPDTLSFLQSAILFNIFISPLFSRK